MNGGLPMSGAEPSSRTLAPFVRMLEIPSAAPWDQDRAARLKALHKSPLPLAEIIVDVKRFSPWVRDQSGRYCAAYARKADIDDAFIWSAEIEGKQLTFRFESEACALRNRRSRLISVGLTVAALVILPLTILKALEVRRANVAQMNAYTLATNRALRVRQTAEDHFRIATNLQRAGLAGRSGVDLLDDLVWLGKTRNPDAGIVAVEWEAGRMTISASTPNPLRENERTVALLDDPAADSSTWSIEKPTRPARNAARGL